MNKGDIFLWLYLSVLSIAAMAFIGYFIRNFIKRRHETEEEKEIREAKATEKWKKREEREKTLNRLFGSIVSFSGIIILIGAGLILVYQCYHWLKFGQWLEIPFFDILSKIDIFIGDESQFQWKGVAKFFIWISLQSSVIVMAVLGFIAVIVGNIIQALI